MTRHLALCADDFGLHPATIDGILALLDQGRLTAVSCLSQSRHWQNAARLLARYRHAISVGLHIDLTRKPLANSHLTTIIAQVLTGSIKPDQIKPQLNQQLEAFEEHWQAPPAFISGHQHVHAFPGIRQCLFEVLQQRYSNQLPWIRNPACLLEGNRHIATTDSPFKCALIKQLCGGLYAHATNNGFSLNSNFAGVYSRSDKANFSRLFASWAYLLPPDGSVIMCHPAKKTGKDETRHFKSQQDEFNYLAGPHFDNLLNLLDTQLGETALSKSSALVLNQ